MRAIALTLSLLATLVACSKDEAPRVTSQGPVVHTETGDVRGTVHSARRVFQGIPYAAAPVGELRWAPPQPAKPWTGERDATKPGSPCPQLKSPIADLSGTNEDCLFLNVTTPARSGEKKPVMVWIHGDGAIGAGHLLDPARLVADGDVVVVTFNFRLGVALDPPQYGATSTSAHLMSKESHGLFDKVIMQSGFTLMDMPAGTTYPGLPALPWYGWTTTKDAQTQGVALAQQLGCKDLACLREVPTAKLLAAPQVMNIFQPYALGNDQLPADPAQALANGDFANVPVLSGTTRDEHTTFVAFFRELAGSPVTAAAYPGLLRTAFGDAAVAIEKEYPLTDYATPAVAWAAVITDRMWAQAQLKQNQLLSAKNPLWFYEFADRHAPLDIPFPKGFQAGAWHAGDVQYLFPSGPTGMTKDQLALSDAMIGYWTNFAHRSDPNGDALPAWPKFTTPETVQSLAPNAIRPVDYEKEHRLAFWRALG
jgi:para-nitrobenzyl esterase